MKWNSAGQVSNARRRTAQVRKAQDYELLHVSEGKYASNFEHYISFTLSSEVHRKYYLGTNMTELLEVQARLKSFSTVLRLTCHNLNAKSNTSIAEHMQANHRICPLVIHDPRIHSTIDKSATN